MKWLVSNKEAAGVTAQLAARRMFEVWARDCAEDTAGTTHLRPWDALRLMDIAADQMREHLEVLYRPVDVRTGNELPDGVVAVRQLTPPNLVDLFNAFCRTEGSLDTEVNALAGLFSFDFLARFLVWAFGKAEVPDA